MVDRDMQDGAELAVDFLKLCTEKRVSGTAVLNALANAFIMTFTSIRFESHADRVKELDKFCGDLRNVIVELPLHHGADGS